MATTTTHRVATRDEWQAERVALLEREKAYTRTGDKLARERQQLPWVRIEKDYTLQTADGPQTLAELFDGRSQLLIYHFMFGPSYEAGCPVNSSIADTFDSLIPHLQARDVTLIAVSGAPIEKLQAYRERMGWRVQLGVELTRATSTPTSAFPAASSRRARRSRRFSTSCRLSPSATPSRPAPTYTAT